MNTGTPPSWSKANSEILQQFLESGTGELFLAHVAASRPSFASDSSDVNAVALRAQLAAGYEKAIGYILSLSNPPEEIAKKSLEYPDLDRPVEDGERVP